MKSLERHRLSPDPMVQFNRWYQSIVRAKNVTLPNAMCLSTSSGGAPEGRMVLLKAYDANGFVFYTNLRSPKARSLFKTRRAALTFYWDPPGRQVRVAGKTELVRQEEADAYFATRDRLSQIGAWASLQSWVLQDRTMLDRRLTRFQKKFQGKPVPRPTHWSGFRLIPHTLEFWQKRSYRLNDRFLYRRTGKKKKWRITRLYP